MNVLFCRLLLLCAALQGLAGCASLGSSPSGQQAIEDRHTHPAWHNWQHRTLPGKQATHYRFDTSDGRAVVAVQADTSVSLLRQNVRREASDLGSLQFSWKVPALITDADLAQRDKADSPVRLVLAFEGDRSTFSMKNAMLSELSLALTGEPMPYATLMYVWCNTRAVGTVLPDPNTDRIRKIVVASGPAQLNQWLKFERNVHADFVQAFQEPPGALVSLALMTDTDNTRSKARAYYGPVVWVGP
jgi:hypothetical protein